MADDSDTFVTIGTPFDIPEDDAPKKKALPLHEQFATDQEGRRRFHGAFTGGFSAGYFNTVGSKEGWTPSPFVSSRSKRSDSSRQKPEDFMDEDDLGEFGIAPRNVETTQLFSREKQQSEKQNVGRGPIGPFHGDSLDSMVRFTLEDLVVPCRMSIGVKLLKKMGWKEGQGIGPRVKQQSKKKVYGCILPPGHGENENEKENEEHDVYAEGLLFAPKDTKPIKFVPKDNLHGIGYKGIAPTTRLEVPKPGYAGSLKIKGQAFGVGAFEEDDTDVYTQDSVSNYDIELHDSEAAQSHLHGWTGPPSHSGTESALSNFAQASGSKPANKVFHPPSIPKGYKPFVGVKESHEDRSEQEEPQKRSSRHHLTSDERGRLLGEQPLAKSVKSVFDYMSKSDKDRLASANDTRVTTPLASKTGTLTESFFSQNTPSSSSGFQPFSNNPAKQARYQNFLQLRKSGKEVNLQKELCGGLTEWEREREKEEFAKSAMLYQPLKGSMAARFIRGSENGDDAQNTRRELPAGVVETVPSKAAELEMFGKLTRETFEWHPAKLLCKRFNIPEPYPSSKTVGLIQERKEKFNLGQLFKSSADDTGQQSADTNNSSTVSSTSSPQRLPEPARQNTTGNQKEEVTPAVSNEQAIKEKPSMDLFKAIFASSSEDESGESQSEGEKEEDVKSVETAVTSTSHVAGNSSQDVSSDGVHLPKGVSVSMDTTSGESQVKASRDENATDRDSVEEPVYGPKPPPSGKIEGAPKPQFKPHQTVPFFGLGSESDSDVSESKTRKKHKHKHKHKQKGREKEKERQKEKRKERGKGGERKKWKERKNEGERANEIHNRVKAKDSRKVCKISSEGSKPNDIPDDKEILSKLKAVQKRRMRAADFM